MKEASFYRTGDQLEVYCELCPHDCRIGDGHSGICKVRYNRRGRLNSRVYGYPAAIHLDPVEKKPFYHYHPGKKVLSIGTRGCNLRCLFCQNASLSMCEIDASEGLQYYESGEIVHNALKIGGNIGIAYTYNEPVVFFEYMFDVALMLAGKGLKNLVVTNGFIHAGPLQSLLRVSDAFNIDLKAFRNDAYMRYMGGSLLPVMESIKAVRKSGKHLEITHLVVPGINDDETVFREMVKWIAGETGPDTPLHLSRYFPAHQLDAMPTTPALLDQYYGIASETLSFVYLGNIRGSKGQDTMCPRCGTAVIQRNGYRITTPGLDTQGKCIACGEKIAETQINISP